MAVTTDMVRTWARPRAVVRDLLAQGRREDRAFAYLMTGCILVFVAQLPKLSRDAALEDVEVGIFVSASVMGILVVWPLAFYLIAWVVDRCAPRVAPWQARLALFWAVLAASPAALLYGLARGFLGDGVQANIVGVLWIAAIVWFTAAGLREAAA